MESTSVNIKEEIHQLINDIDDLEFLKAVQTIISAKVQETSEFLSDEEIHMLEERQADYLSGKSKTYTWKEVKARLKPKADV